MTAHKSDVASSIPDEPMTMTLRLRSGPSVVAERRQRRIAERLEAVSTESGIEELRTERWSDRVRVPDTEGSAAMPAVTLYEELRAAVDEAGGRLHPFFQEREAMETPVAGAEPTATDGVRPAESATDDERDIVFPVICLTTRRSGRLTGVYPCWLDGDHHSVEDGLARLEAATDDGRNPDATMSGAVENLW
ncbi:HTH domain-containing protein [Halorientalis sp.]|uniref:HTH domain-containing protein n=1 Tax=Halorientalis sp. TaxID=1931229 RepID=UPI002614C55D|nr:HTH domain-containing protein [Halorientalis sp.]